MGVAFEEPNAWMLECPDFYELDGKDVLTFSPVGIKGEYSSYLIGRLDYEKGRFQVESRGILDYGVDFYAPQTFLTPEGERYVIGWQNGWEWMDEWNGFGELTENSWCGAMSIPRKVIRKGDRLHALLPKEIAQLKAAETVIYDTQTDGYQKSVSTIQNPTLIELSLEAGETPITLVFKDKRTGQTDTFTIEEHLRYHSEGNPMGRKDLTLPLSSRSKTLKILLDLYAIEVFDEDEGTVLSVNSFFKGTLARDFSFSCSEKGRLKQVVVTELNGKQLIKRSVKG
jgi:beta-fructofuranosidase